MDKLILENVRCFHSCQEIELAPITLLVGENSSGKSTFLSLLRIATDLGYRTPNFNEEPFLLGAFDQIAHYHGGRGGRAKAFTLGYCKATSFPTLGSVIKVLASFTEQDGQATISQLQVKSQAHSIKFLIAEKRVELQTPSGPINLEDSPTLRRLIDFPELSLYTLRALLSVSQRDKSGSPNRDFEIFIQMLDSVMVERGARPYVSAPIRTRPQRTYDPVKDIPGPEGGHVPMLLAKLQFGDPRKWSRFQRSLKSFGESSGLFKEVGVKRIGRKSGNPFQLQVQIDSASFNLVDVGYGVSQILPIMVDAINADPGKVFLLQQPEVHLHPRAQAELGTFFGLLAKTQKKRFVIETHSDYLIDRIRLDIRDSDDIKPEDVALLYFERRKNNDVFVYRLDLDHRGNILNAPPEYRSFFLREDDRFFNG